MRRTFINAIVKLLVIVVMSSSINILTCKPVEANPLWYLLAPVLSTFLNKVISPDRQEVWPASAAVMELETPDGRPLPPIAVTRQQAIILRKGVRIRAIKPGVVGPPLKKLEYYRDGDKTTLISVTDAPWSVGTGRGNQCLDTASADWKVGGIYTLNLYFECDKQAATYGKEGWNAIQVVVQDDSFFRWAVTDPNYRQYLADGMGTLPSIPVSRVVDEQGNVGFSVGNGPAAMPTVDTGVTTVSTEVRAEQRDGLKVRFLHHGVPVTDGKIYLSLSDRTRGVDLEGGPLVARTAFKVLDGSGRELYSRVGDVSRTITFNGWTEGDYIILAQGQGADGSIGPGEKIELHITK